MSDETIVDAGSETSGGTDETSQTDSTNTTTETVQTDTAVEDAGGAADEKQQDSETHDKFADSEASRTGIVEGIARTGDPCVCPDGRPGTVNVFAGGLAICLPNQG